MRNSESEHWCRIGYLTVDEWGARGGRMRAAVISAEELERLLARDFPESFYPGCGWSILDVWHGGARVRRAFGNDTTRPGGTISGPTIMTLADFAMYAAVLGSIGWE